MDLKELSSKYEVRKIEERDIPEVYALCLGNPQYYRHCPPMISRESLLKDLIRVPEGKSLTDKWYLGFWEQRKLVAVLDLIHGFPNDETAFLGFFMMRRDLQGRGVGSGIIQGVLKFLKGSYRSVRLGYVKGNLQSENFWRKNGFLPTGAVSKQALYEVVIVERNL